MTKYASAEIKRKYFRERRRIQSTLRRAELKPGRMVDRNILPSIPKRVTEASVRRLEKISSKAIQEKAVTAFDVFTGELIGTGRQAINRERIQRYQENIPNETDYAIEAFESIIDRAEGDGRAQSAYLLREMLENAISTQGRENVARALEENMEYIMDLAERILYYASERYETWGRDSDIARIAGILRQPIVNEQIANAIVRDDIISGENDQW